MHLNPTGKWKEKPRLKTRCGPDPGGNKSTTQEQRTQDHAFLSCWKPSASSAPWIHTPAGVSSLGCLEGQVASWGDGKSPFLAFIQVKDSGRKSWCAHGAILNEPRVVAPIDTYTQDHRWHTRTDAPSISIWRLSLMCGESLMIILITPVYSGSCL